MKNLSTMLIIYLVGFTVTGCFECRNDECPAHPEFAFKVLDEDGKSLVGITPYAQPVTSDTIQVVGLTRDKEWTGLNLVQDGSILSFRINYEIEHYLIKYSFAKDDSLHFFDMTTRSSACCSIIVDEYSLKINNILRIPDNPESVHSFIK